VTAKGGHPAAFALSVIALSHEAAFGKIASFESAR